MGMGREGKKSDVGKSKAGVLHEKEAPLPVWEGSPCNVPLLKGTPLHDAVWKSDVGMAFGGVYMTVTSSSSGEFPLVKRTTVSTWLDCFILMSSV